MRVFVGVDRAQPAFEERRAMPAPRLLGRVAHPVAERPHRAPATVLCADVVEPGALVIHEVVKAAVVELCGIEE